MEQIIIENETSPFRYLIYLLRQNYFTNYYSELNLLLHGINTSSTTKIIIHNKKLIEHLYNKINNISLIHDLIVNIYQKIISNNYPMSYIYDLKKFYPAKILEKFANTLNFIIPSKFNDKFSEKTNIKLKKTI
jgi:hypothetical protein